MKTGYAPFARTKRECSCIWHKKLDFHYLNAALRRRKGGKSSAFPWKLALRPISPLFEGRPAAAERRGMVTVNINEKEWLDGVYEKICAKMLATAERNQHKIPYTCLLYTSSMTVPKSARSAFFGSRMYKSTLVLSRASMMVSRK